MQDILKSYYASGGKTLFENQILLEYDRATTINKWGDKIILAAVANNRTENGDEWMHYSSGYDGDEDHGRLWPWMEVLTRGAPESEYPDYDEKRQKFLTDFLTELEEADPTDNNQYVMWLVKTYVQSIKADAKHQANFEREAAGSEAAGHWSEWDTNDVPDDHDDRDEFGDYVGSEWSVSDPTELNSFRLEDVDQISETLANYHRIKPQLPEPERDINRFKTFTRLEDYVDGVMDGDQIPNPETDDKTLNRSDVELIYNGPLGTVTIPKSFEASCELGSGTKWCTTGRNDDYYKSYSKKGDLIIYNEKPGNNKYQIHPTLTNVEIRDARDRTVSDDKYTEFTETHTVLSKLIKQKQREIFNKLAQADVGYDDLDYDVDHSQRASALIKLNKEYQTGEMNYVEQYYELVYFEELKTIGQGLPDRIFKQELAELIMYAEQRGKPWPEMQALVAEYVKQEYQDLPTDASIEKFNKQNKAPSFPADQAAAKRLQDIEKQAHEIQKSTEAKKLLIRIKQFKQLKNPWPELDAIQAQIESTGVTNTPDDMNIEGVDLSDIRSDYDVIELSEQVFRRSGRMYFTTRHADEQRVNRGITDSKMETAISMLEQDLDWLIYMGMNDFQMGDALSIFDPKSNITMVVVYKRPPLDPVTKEPTEVNPDKPQAINIATVYHGSPITSTKIPKILKRNNFRMKSGGQQKLTTRSPNQREFWHLGKGIQQGGNEKIF